MPSKPWRAPSYYYMNFAVLPILTAIRVPSRVKNQFAICHCVDVSLNRILHRIAYRFASLQQRLRILNAEKAQPPLLVFLLGSALSAWYFLGVPIRPPIVYNSRSVFHMRSTQTIQRFSVCLDGYFSIQGRHVSASGIRWALVVVLMCRVNRGEL